MLVSKMRSKFQADKGFKEEEHPRASTGKHAGEFVKKGTGKTSASKKNKTKQENLFKKDDFIKERNFSNKNFSNQKFQGISFNRASFQGSLLNNTVINDNDMHNCLIQGASFKNAKINYSTFPKDLSNVDFTNAKIQNMACLYNIENMKFNGTKFHNLKLDGIEFFQSFDDILLAAKKGASFKNAVFMGQKVDNAIKYDVDFESLKEKYHKAMKGKFSLDKEAQSLPIGFLEKTVGILQADKINVSLDDSKAIIGWKTRNGKGDLHFSIDKKNKVLHLELMNLSGSLQSRGLALNIVRNFEKQAKTLGVDRISLYADISIGTYAWPRLGFDFKNASTMSKIKREIINFCKETKTPLDDSLKKKINNLKTAHDVALFDIGKTYSFKEAPHIKKNHDVDPNLKMHLGKIILLSTDSFIATKGI